MIDRHPEAMDYDDHEENRDSDSASNTELDPQSNVSGDEGKDNEYNGGKSDIEENRDSKSRSRERETRGRRSESPEKMSPEKSPSKSPDRSRSRSQSGEKRDRSRSVSKTRKRGKSKRSRSKSRDRSVSRSKRSESKETSRSRSKDSVSPKRRRSRTPKKSRRRSSSRDRSRRRRSRSHSRRRSRRSRSRSTHRRRRSRSRSSSRAGYRLHIADLDVDTSKRDLERLFEPFGEVREIWMARSPPCFAFIVFEKQRDADEALRECNGAIVRHSRIRVTEARPRARGSRARSSYDPNMRCYQCGQVGHFSRDCTEAKFGYRRPQSPRMCLMVW